jgi:hypothetical protein
MIADPRLLHRKPSKTSPLPVPNDLCPYPKCGGPMLVNLTRADCRLTE